MANYLDRVAEAGARTTAPFAGAPAAPPLMPSPLGAVRPTAGAGDFDAFLQAGELTTHPSASAAVSFAPTAVPARPAAMPAGPPSPAPKISAAETPPLARPAAAAPPAPRPAVAPRPAEAPRFDRPDPVPATPVVRLPRDGTANHAEAAVLDPVFVPDPTVTHVRMPRGLRPVTEGAVHEAANPKPDQPHVVPWPVSHPAARLLASVGRPADTPAPAGRPATVAEEEPPAMGVVEYTALAMEPATPPEEWRVARRSPAGDTSKTPPPEPAVALRPAVTPAPTPAAAPPARGPEPRPPRLTIGRIDVAVHVQPPPAPTAPPAAAPAPDWPHGDWDRFTLTR